MRDYGWAGDFYDRIDAIGEPDDTLAGKSTDEQAAVLAPEDWLGRSPGDSASPQSGYAGQPRELQGGGKMSWLGGAVTYEPKAKPFSADNPRMAPVYTEPSFVESLRGEMAPGVNQGALERMRQELSPPGAWKYTPADSPEDDLRRLIGLEVGGLR